MIGGVSTMNPSTDIFAFSFLLQDCGVSQTLAVPIYEGVAMAHAVGRFLGALLMVQGFAY